MSLSSKEFIWHDGNIRSLSYSIDKGGVRLEILGEFYSHTGSAVRDTYTIECDGVTRFSNLIDFDEVVDNLHAGSISNGYVNGSTLRLYLIEGMIEIDANKIQISKY